MRQLEAGDRWFQTQDTELAAVLCALDFEFYDKENPASIREVKGKTQVTWQFEVKDKKGDREAHEVYRAFKNPKKYTQEKPTDPISYTVAAIKNFRLFNESIKTAKPMVGYELGKRTLWCLKDSPQELKLQSDRRAKKV